MLAQFAQTFHLSHLFIVVVSLFLVSNTQQSEVGGYEDAA